jgi:hypothetical protein
MTDKGANLNLLRRAWDALDSFKQAYPENWHEEDQAVLDDLIKADNAIQRAQTETPTLMSHVWIEQLWRNK